MRKTHTRTHTHNCSQHTCTTYGLVKESVWNPVVAHLRERVVRLARIDLRDAGASDRRAEKETGRGLEETPHFANILQRSRGRELAELERARRWRDQLEARPEQQRHVCERERHLAIAPAHVHNHHHTWHMTHERE